MGGAQCLNVQQIKAQNTKSHLQPGEDGGAGTGGADNRSEVGESRTTRCCPWEKKQEHKKHQLDQKCSRIIFCVSGLFSHSGWPRGWLGRGLEGQSGNLRWQLGFNRSLLPFSCLCLCLCFCLCLCLSSLFIVFVIVNVSVFVSLDFVVVGVPVFVFVLFPFPPSLSLHCHWLNVSTMLIIIIRSGSSMSRLRTFFSRTRSRCTPHRQHRNSYCRCRQKIPLLA